MESLGGFNNSTDVSVPNLFIHCHSLVGKVVGFWVDILSLWVWIPKVRRVIEGFWYVNVCVSTCTKFNIFILWFQVYCVFFIYQIHIDTCLISSNAKWHIWWHSYCMRANLRLAGFLKSLKWKSCPAYREGIKFKVQQDLINLKHGLRYIWNW